MRTALTIAGADPSGGAGIQSDIAAFRAFGVTPLSVITALTAQNGVKVRSAQPVSARFVARQIDVLLEEFSVDSVKIGMIGNRENTAAIRRLIKKHNLKNVVLDTVLRSSNGFPLIDKKGVEAIKKLLPLVTIVTPNLMEAEALTGIKAVDADGMEEAARRLHSMGATFALVKGGHLDGEPIDILYDGKRFTRFAGRRIAGTDKRLHGTGCLLSAAIAAGLAKGESVKRAVRGAKAYVERVIEKRV